MDAQFPVLVVFSEPICLFCFIVLDQHSISHSFKEATESFPGSSCQTSHYCKACSILKTVQTLQIKCAITLAAELFCVGILLRLSSVLRQVGLGINLDRDIEIDDRGGWRTLRNSLGQTPTLPFPSLSSTVKVTLTWDSLDTKWFEVRTCQSLQKVENEMLMFNQDS